MIVTRPRAWLRAALWLLAGAALGQALLSTQLWAQLKKGPPPPQVLLSADERSEPVFREMLATLKRIDERLAVIERAARQSAGNLEEAPPERRPARARAPAEGR